MRLVEVFVVSGASQTCFKPPSRTKLLPLREDVRNFSTNVLLHLLLLSRAMNHENPSDRKKRS